MNPKLQILVIDDDLRMTHTLKDILTISGHDVFCADSAVHGIEFLEKQKFDCVLTDVKMPEMDGVSFYSVLHKKQPGIPVVLMTAYAADDIIRHGLDEGIIGVLNKPLDISHLLDFFSTLAKQRTIAIVDDDSVFCKTLEDILNKRGFNVTSISDPHLNINLIAAESQVVLLDLKLNSITGLDIMRNIREVYKELPVVLITAYRNEMIDSIKIALENSAFTCLYKPLEIPELVQTLTNFQLARLREAIKKQ
jgi:two-component system, NtrC family, response regulator HydG